DRDVTAARERIGDDCGHAGLRLSIREAGQPAREDAFGGEQIRERLHRRTIARNPAASAAPNLGGAWPNPAFARPATVPIPEGNTPSPSVQVLAAARVDPDEPPGP